MAIFQPTNIVPDMKNGIANGVFLVEDPANPEEKLISWKFNGNSELVAVQIDYYENTAASTLVYSTGKITAGGTPPVFGVDNGRGWYDLAEFAYMLSDLGFSYDTEYKMKITQWWTANDSVEQYSASVFKIVKGVEFGTQPSYSATDPAIQFQETIDKTNSPDTSFDWIRWELYRQPGQNSLSSERTKIYDSGPLYSPIVSAGNTADFDFDYVGLADGRWYAVKFTAQTCYGQILERTTVFQTAFAQDSVPGEIRVVCDYQKQAAAIQVTTGTELAYEASGNPSVANGVLRLGEADKIHIEPNDAFETPWELWWKGKLQGQSAVLFEIMQTNDVSIKLEYNADNCRLYSTPTDLIGSSGLYLPPDARFAALVYSATGSGYLKLNLYIDEYGGGLLPSNSLYPSNSLFPRDGTHMGLVTFSYVSHTVQDMLWCELGGPAEYYEFQIFDGALSDDTLAEMQHGWYQADDSLPSYALLWMSGDSLTILSVPLGRSEITGISAYRIEGDEVLYLGVFGDAQTIYDYGVQNGHKYQYLVLFFTANGVSSLLSAEISPCFWTWTLIEAEPQPYWTYAENLKMYNVKAVYVFANNVSSGTVSNNAAPAVYGNFTRYPTVMKSPQNYQSGTLAALIGLVRAGEYSDSISMRDAIFALSSSTSDLFIKNRKGDLLKIEIAGAIQMTTGDNSKAQELTAQIPWVEIADTKGVALVSYET